MGGGQPSNTTTTTVQQLPAWLNNANTFGAQQAQNLYQTGGPAYYPGNTVAPFSPMQEQYLSGVENLASNGSPVMNTANSQMQTMLSGAYLNPASNPYLQQTFNDAANAVQQKVGSEFAGSGRNPEASVGVQNDQMNQLASQIYGGNYQNAMDNLTKVTAYAPAYDSQTWGDLGQLGQAGSQVQQQAGNMQTANQNLYNYYAQLPWTNLSNYMGQVNSLASGGSASTTQPYMGPSKTQTALGGAATGAALGSMVAGASSGAIAGPVGMGVGAGLGLLAGYFG